MDLSVKAKLAPNEPGVYIFYGPKGEYLYIGKARRLRNRLLSYFRESYHRENKKVASIVQEACHLDYIVVSNEREALLLEASLIFEHKPKYNVMLKDAEFYPYIEITQDDFPTVRIVRRRTQDGLYFGPFTDVKFVRDLIDFLQQVYHFRTCQKDFQKDSEKKAKPCMDFYIHRCEGPCNGQMSKTEYAERCINPVKDFLSGDVSSTLELIENKMKRHAQMMDFENAAKYRDLLLKFEKVMEKQGVVLEQSRNLDVIGRAKDLYVLLRVRGGHLLAKLVYELDSTDVRDFVFNYYMVHKNEIPQAVIVEKNIDLGMPGYFGKPRDEIEQDLLKKAVENAKNELSIKGLRKDALNSLKNLLSLSRYPQRIEGFDVAHLQGKFTVASVVTFVDGLPFKQGYRHYKFEGGKIDDFGTMKELVKRRYPKHPVPDLILVDGGIGQVRAVKTALQELNMDCEVIGLAKERETVCTEKSELILQLDSPILRMLVAIRDEAHRFANTFHRKLRTKEAVLSVLNEIPGLGPKRMKKLVEAFKSTEELKKSSVEQIAKIIGSRKLASTILSRI
ncbi:MAG: excinuclease ABC subunit UvrC [Pseudothermotoga sp.]